MTFEGKAFSNFFNLSIQRKYQNNEAIDTNNNFNDFEILNFSILKQFFVDRSFNNKQNIGGALAKNFN